MQVKDKTVDTYESKASSNIPTNKFRIMQSGMSIKLWHNCGEPQFGVEFPPKLRCSCDCGVHFPKIVVGFGVVVDKI